MPNVPNVPGVPPLASYGGNDIALVATDAAVILSVAAGATWGIYANGAPVFLPANLFAQTIGAALAGLSSLAALVGLPNVAPVPVSFAEFEYAADSPISNYPQEQGAFQSYDKVQLPFDVRVKLACGGSASDRQQFFTTLESLRTSTTLVDVVTPEFVYSNVNCTHVDYRRTSQNGVTLIVATAWFEQVPVSASTTFSNTQQPSDAGQQANGNVQPQNPSASTQSIYGALGPVN